MIYGYTPSAYDVEARVLDRWSFEGLRPLPIPRTDRPPLACGACSEDSLIVRSWRFFTRGGDSTHPYRCDVATKCATCSALTWFGVVVPDEVWQSLPRHLIGLTIRRGEAVERGWVEQQTPPPSP